jgi:outer membrane protein OmpA-like peptidoglycan-associated protein
MRIGQGARAGGRRGVGRARALAAAAALAAALLSGCAAVAPGAAPGPAAEAAGPGSAPPDAALLPLDAAVRDLADALLSRAAGAPGTGGRALAIDPFVDRTTGTETAATRAAVAGVEARLRGRHRQVELRPFTTAGLADRPLVLLGVVAAAGAEAAAGDPAAIRPRAYRVRVAQADPRSGRVLDAASAWVRAADIDAAPAPFFRDSPGWLPDPAAAAYLRTAEAPPGGAMDPVYLQGLAVQALVADGMVAYESGRFREALGLYAEAQRLPAGDQMRVHNGVYLANWVLGQQEEAEAAFARVVDFGLRHGRLAVKFLFRPGSTALWAGPGLGNPYGAWIRQIARLTEERAACLELTGHASPTGAAAVNERLSLGRAERVRSRLAAERPGLAERTRAEGAGAREPLVGTGADDVSDALDRRVEIQPVDCGALLAAGGGAGGGAPRRTAQAQAGTAC